MGRGIILGAKHWHSCTNVMATVKAITTAVMIVGVIILAVLFVFRPLRQ
jgi:hypothetical protein